MTNDWMAVIGISVAVMAVVQIVMLVALAVALRRLQNGIQVMERKVDDLTAELKPQIVRAVEDVRSASASAQELLTDIRRHLETMEDAADAIRQRVTRVVDGVHSAASNLPVPMRVSGPAAMALWAGVRAIRSVAGRMRARRERHVHDRFDEADSYIGVG